MGLVAGLAGAAGETLTRLGSPWESAQFDLKHGLTRTQAARTGRQALYLFSGLLTCGMH